MQARMTNPALSVPGVLDALQALGKAASKAGLPNSPDFDAAEFAWPIERMPPEE
jgi:hypothetical protein